MTSGYEIVGIFERRFGVMDNARQAYLRELIDAALAQCWTISQRDAALTAKRVLESQSAP